MRPCAWIVIAGLAGPAELLGSEPSSPLSVSRLETNAAPQPLGIDDPAPRLTWALESGRRGVMQAACRVLVASRPELGREGQADVWDSARVGVVRSVGRLRRPRAPVPHALLLGRRVWTSDGQRATGRDRHGSRRRSGRERVEGPVDRGPERAGPSSEAAGKADDETIRAAGELCRPTAWLTSGLRGGAGQEQPGRVPRAPPGADAAQVLPGRRSPSPAPASTRPGWRTTS